MNDIINKFLDQFMPELHGRQTGFTYSSCGTSEKRKQEYKNSKQQETPSMSTGTN